MSRGSRGRGGSFRFNEGDWTCPNCDNVNFARRTQCNRCGEDRKYDVKKIKKGGIEIGKSAAEKSKGLFSADDWMCKTCGNVNWARRGDCNVCNTPKVNVQEERTGLGGGFNEREGVEYKEKEDSDSEYDIYGRKKKKYRDKLPSGSKMEQTGRGHDAGEKIVQEDAAQYDDDDDDDDEEDEEEDGDDVGIYDLEASSDEEKAEKKRSRSRSSERKNGIPRSRSRSQSGSRGRRHRSSSSSSSGDRRSKRKHRREKSRSRSRSPRHRNSRSTSRDGHRKRH